jgi:glycine/D-amino acid oxidase-like deaminating enzyme
VRRRHAFVLGSGVAGLSLAEILSRNGWKITLVEALPELGGDASRNTQNWLHTGWLYAALPYDNAMKGCARALRLFRSTYSRVLGPSIVNVEASEAGVSYPASPDGWFAAELVHYLFAVGTSDLSALQRLTWRHYLELVPFRRLRALGYEVAPQSKPHGALVKLMNRWEGDPGGHEKYQVVPSTDARLFTRRILSSLLALLGADTEVITGAEYEVRGEGDRTVVHINGKTHTPDLVILATGKGAAKQLTAIDKTNVALRIKSIRSPIVVLDHALDLPNFIRFTPQLPETVNHIKVPIDGGADVSTIGSYDYHPVDEAPDIRPFIGRVCDRIGIPTTAVVGSYYGTKTELTEGLPRRYNHALEQVNANTYLALAGKFSQFPLLVHEFAEKVGLRTDIGNEARGALGLAIADTGPEKLLKGMNLSLSTFLAARPTTPPSRA